MWNELFKYMVYSLVILALGGSVWYFVAWGVELWRR